MLVILLTTMSMAAEPSVVTTTQASTIQQHKQSEISLFKNALHLDANDIIAIYNVARREEQIDTLLTTRKLWYPSAVEVSQWYFHVYTYTSMARIVIAPNCKIDPTKSKGDAEKFAPDEKSEIILTCTSNLLRPCIEMAKNILKDTKNNNRIKIVLFPQVCLSFHNDDENYDELNDKFGKQNILKFRYAASSYPFVFDGLGRLNKCGINIPLTVREGWELSPEKIRSIVGHYQLNLSEIDDDEGIDRIGEVSAMDIRRGACLSTLNYIVGLGVYGSVRREVTRINV